MLSTHHLKVNTPQVEAQEIIHKEDTHSITTPNMGIILQNSTNKCGPIIVFYFDCFPGMQDLVAMVVCHWFPVAGNLVDDSLMLNLFPADYYYHCQ
jgi:hypothetical protein